MKTEIDLTQLNPKERYKLITGVVTPRPIAFVTSLNETGTVNAAPFSFFNALSSDPCLIVLGLNPREDGSLKDTARNIGARGEFVVNMVDEGIAEQMNVCATDFPPGFSEVEETGLTPASSVQVKTPRIAESPAALECLHYQTVEVGGSRSIILGEVVHAAVRSDAVDAEKLRMDFSRYQPIGRLAGSLYSRFGEIFKLKRMTPEQYRADKSRHD